MASENRGTKRNLAFIGFGEAAAAFVEGWGGARDFSITAYDIKTGNASREVQDAKWADFRRAGVTGCATASEAVAGADIVFSTVTADQAVAAAQSVRDHIGEGVLYLDCNSCSPGSKRQASEIISGGGGRYTDAAVMAPVHPKLHKTPVLISGAHAEAALEAMQGLDMSVSLVPGEIGRASSIKMVRSIMIKGLEALTLECILSARRAGVDDIVLASLEETFPGFNWPARAAYMLERVMTHGVRRAAEMKEVAVTVDELGLDSGMSHACVAWQQRVGDLRLRAGATDQDYRERADAILQRLDTGGV